MESKELLTNTDRSQKKVRFQEGPPPVVHGPWIVLADTGLVPFLLSGSAQFDSSRSYSRSENIRIQLKDASLLEFEVDIANIGNSSSQLTNLIFIFWGEDDKQIGYYPYPLNISVPCSDNFEGAPVVPGIKRERGKIEFPLQRSLPGADPITDTSQITHVYVIGYDPGMDFMDRICETFVKTTLDGNKATDQNPCRSSLKIACWTQQKPSFVLTGNSLQHNVSAMVECALMLKGPVSANANFGLMKPTRNVWNYSLQTSNYGFLEGVHPLPRGGVDFLLNSERYGDKVSSTPANCRISPHADGDIVDLEWEDGADSEYNDYKIRVIHR